VEADFVVRTVVKDLDIVKIKIVSRIAYMIVNFENTFLSNNVTWMLTHTVLDLPTSLPHIDSITVTAINLINHSRSLRN